MWGKESRVKPNGGTNKNIKSSGICSAISHTSGICSYFSDLTLCGEEDSGKRVRQSCAVSSKQAASLVHVDPQLEDLFH